MNLLANNRDKIDANDDGNYQIIVSGKGRLLKYQLVGEQTNSSWQGRPTSGVVRRTQLFLLPPPPFLLSSPPFSLSPPLFTSSSPFLLPSSPFLLLPLFTYFLFKFPPQEVWEDEITFFTFLEWLTSDLRPQTFRSFAANWAPAYWAPAYWPLAN